MKYISIFLLSFTLYAQNTQEPQRSMGSFFSNAEQPDGAIQEACDIQIPEDCETCIGELSGYSDQNKLINFGCEYAKALVSDRAKKEEYKFPEVGHCYSEDDPLTTKSALRICTCIGDEMIRHPEINKPLTPEIVHATNRSMAVLTISTAIDSAKKTSNRLNSILKESDGSSCDPLEKLKNAAKANKCGFYSNVINESLAKVQDEIPAYSQDMFSNYFMTRNSVPVGAAVTSENNIFHEFKDAMQMYENAYRNKTISMQELTNVRSIITKSFGLLEGGRGRPARNDREKADAFSNDLSKQFASFDQFYCHNVSKKLMDACNLDKSLNEVEATAKILEDPRFTSESQEARFNLQNEASIPQSGDNALEKDDLIQANTMVVCQAYKNDLFGSLQACTDGDPLACKRKSDLGGMLCHSISDMYKNDPSQYIKKVVDRVAVKPITNIDSLLSPGGFECSNSGPATAIYDAVIESLNGDFSYIDATPLKISEVSNSSSEVAVRNEPIVRTSNTNQTDNTVYNSGLGLPIAEATAVSIPMLPAENQELATTSTADQIEQFVPTFDPNFAGAFSNETIGKSLSDSTDKSADSIESNDSEISKLMAEIKAMNERLASNDRELQDVNQQMAVPELDPIEKEKLELERIKLENERLRLEIERQKLTQQKDSAEQDVKDEVAKSSSKVTSAVESTQDEDASVSNVVANQNTESMSTKAIANGKTSAPGSATSNTNVDKSQSNALNSQDGFTLSGVYISSATEVSDFFAGNKTYRKHKIILDDPDNAENVIVCILPPDTLKTAVKNKKQEFSYQDYLCGDPVKKQDLDDIKIAQKEKVPKAKKQVDVAEPEINDPGATFQSVKDIMNQAK